MKGICGKKGEEGGEVNRAEIEIKQQDLIESRVVGRLRLGADKGGLGMETRSLFPASPGDRLSMMDERQKTLESWMLRLSSPSRWSRAYCKAVLCRPRQAGQGPPGGGGVFNK